MGERIIYSTLCTLKEHDSVAAAASLLPFVEMARLWAAHLRGPGEFNGRLVLLTNVADLRIESAESIRVPIDAASRRELFLERVRRFRHVPVRTNDQVVQLDLDALAVAPVEALFAAIRPDVLVAARSAYSPLVHQHAGGLMTRRERWACRLRGWYYRGGISACVTGCDGRTWTRVMRRWSAAMRARGRGRLVPALGDQSFLNFLFVTGAAPIERLPRRLIYHVRQPGVPLDDPDAARAVVLHFPLAQKLELMRRWSRV